MRSVFRSVNSRSPFSFVDSKNLNQNAISALSNLERTTARSLIQLHISATLAPVIKRKPLLLKLNLNILVKNKDLSQLLSP